MFTTLVLWLLKNLSVKDRTKLVNALINNALDAVPLKAIITIDENRRILVDGKALSPEQNVALTEGAYAALNNQALQLVREHVRFAAIDQGFLKSDDPTKQLFYKAALWYAQEEKNLLTDLSRHSTP